MQQQGYPDASGPAQPPIEGGFDGQRRGLPGVEGADWRRELRRTILSRVLPRLSNSGEEPDVTPHMVTEDQVARFADLAVAVAVPGLVEQVDLLRAGGLSAEAVVLQLLAPAARRLGDMWLDDRLGFVDVTAGLGRLQGVMRALSLAFDAPGTPHVQGRRILLAPVSGEQHIFGLSVVAAFFRRAGWEVTFEPRIAFADLVALVRTERFTAIGLSLAGDRFVGAFPSQVEALRRASLNAGVVMLAGGPAFALDPDLHRRVGVDAVASDAVEAVQMAEALAGQPTAERAPR